MDPLDDKMPIQYLNDNPHFENTHSVPPNTKQNPTEKNPTQQIQQTSQQTNQQTNQ